MITKEFESICDTMLMSRMQNIDTLSMKSYKIDKSSINSDNALYKSAVGDSSALSLVYTQPGYNSLGLMMDRARALISEGETPGKIAVLCATDVSAQIVKNNVPDITVMTTQDFIDALYCANYQNHIISTDDIMSASIKLITDNPDAETEEFIKILDMADSQNKIILTSLFANNHKDKLLSILDKTCQRLRFTTEAICQNTTYSMPNNPFDFNALIMNNVSNTNIPTLCTILGYANRYHSNLYLIGSPEETIYSFQASYRKSLDIIASQSSNGNIGIIRLNDDPDTNPDIIKFMRMKPLKDKSIISTQKILVQNISNDAAIVNAFENKIGYITTKLNEGKRVLVCAPYSHLLETIKPVLEKTYPNAKIYQASQRFNPPMRLHFGALMSIYDELVKKYPNTISIGDFYFEIVKRRIPIAHFKNKREMTKEEINNFKTSFADKSLTYLGDYDTKLTIKDIYIKLIMYECQALQEYYGAMKKHKTEESDFAADIVLSTIHTAIDMQYNNVVVILPDQFIRGLHFASCGTEELMYQRNVALTRATESEHIILLPREDKSTFLSYTNSL